LVLQNIPKKMAVRISNYLIIICLLIFSAVSQAQTRYQEATFDSVKVDTYTYANKDGQNLDLDFYAPIPDPEQHRPLIIYVHGGGFSGGSRNSPEIASFCRELATYGYACASITYRLTRQNKETGFGCDCTAVEKLNTFHSAVEDLQDATFFLVERREVLGIDPQKMILAGSSAGAETVLNTAYQPPYCYGLDSGPVSYAGVISMAGAIPDTTRLFRESAITSLLFHGTCDDLVPYASAPHRHCRPDQPGYLPMHGSLTISRKLAELGVPYWLHTTCGANHEIAGKPMQDHMDVIIQFCYEFVLQKKNESFQTVVPGNQHICEYEHFNFCDQ
jgi:predicted esterase